MNKIYGIYCRIYQEIFHMAAPILPYRTPKILSYANEAADLLAKERASHALLVIDSFLHKSGAAKELIAEIRERDIGVVVFDEVTPNPTIECVEKAREAYLQGGCDSIIGFGGGSAIDCAKGVGARIARPRKSLQKMRGILKILKKPPFTIAIPTTAGTGSETTVTIVLTDGESHEKYPISDLCLIPDAALLDEKLTATLPQNMTATTGLDALVHVVEAYIGRSALPSVRRAAKEAVRLVFDNIEIAFRDGGNLAARKNMLRAAYLGGYSFSRAYVGYCHAVAHTLGGKYNIPHGLANAVLLPYVLDFYGEKVYKKLWELAVAGGICDEKCAIEEGAHRFIGKLLELNRNMGIPEKLCGICEKDIPELARLAAKEANPLYPVPVLMDAKALERFYYDVAEDMK